MKKTLSIVLSLLMVLGCMTCLFTMPATAEEASTITTESTVETLPDNILSSATPTNSVVTAETSTVNDYNGGSIDYGTSAMFSVKGWNAGKYGDSDSLINSGVYYQVNFKVKVSETITDGAYLYPALYNNGGAKQFTSLVGVRYEETTPGAVETAYNNVSSIALKVTDTITDAAILEAGKTYNYTYIFAASYASINKFIVRVNGLSEGESVTITDGYMFDLTGTEWDNFDYNGKKIVHYMVKEDDNVFMRVYGYRAVGIGPGIQTSQIPTNNNLSAKLGGDYYNLYFEGGNTYKMNFDFRIPEGGILPTDDDSTTYSDSKTNKYAYAPGYDFYETGKLDYTEAYNSVKSLAGSTDSDKQSYVISAGDNTEQKKYADTTNGYSYYYLTSATNTRLRRLSSTDIVRFSYYDTSGNSVYSKSGKTSMIGRDNVSGTLAYDNAWVNGCYEIDAMPAQSLEEAATVAATDTSKAKSAVYARYTYANGKWTYNSDYGSFFVPAEKDVTVALGITYIYSGGVYDFDSFSLSADVDIVEYKNTDGEVIDLPASETPATVNEVLKGTTSTYTISDHNNYDGFVFEGWYVNGEFDGTDATITAASTDTVKPVITYRNIITNAGGFEDGTDGKSLRLGYTDVGPTDSGAANEIANLSKTYKYHSAEPTGNMWGYWVSDKPLATVDTELLTKYPYITTDGSFGGDNFFQITTEQGSQTVQYASYADGTPTNDSKVEVSPHRGNGMLMNGIHSRTAVRRLDGLEKGKNYVLSFYSWSPTVKNYLKSAFVTDSFMYLNKVANAGSSYGGTNNLGGLSTITATADSVQKWNKYEFMFTANADHAYFALLLQNGATTNNQSFVDDLVVYEVEVPTEWDFEDGSTEYITANAGSTIEVVDAEDQPAKIGDKYLQYTSTTFAGMTFNFEYDSKSTYIISYDFKIFQYGGDGTYTYVTTDGETKRKDSHNANGIDSCLTKFDDGKYGGTYLHTADNNIVTRYYEDGTTFKNVKTFSHLNQGENNYYGRSSEYVENEDNTGGTIKYGTMGDEHGGSALWENWQHFEIEVNPDGNDYVGLVEYGIRPNGGGWEIGIDNFKVTKVSATDIAAADGATEGTTIFNIRAETETKKQGLRFKSTIDLDILDELGEGAKIVEYGTIAANSDKIGGHQLVRQAAKDKAKNGDSCIVVGVAYNRDNGTDVRYALDDETNVLTYTGVLTGISAKNYDIDFKVRGYAIIEDANGVRYTVYDDIKEISVYDAAKIVAANPLSDTDKAAAEAAIKAYEATLSTEA